MSFNDLGLKPELSRAVAEKGYVTPTPVQAAAIPAVLAGRDVLAGAQTGTGKTAAFVLPILSNLATARGSTPRALILTPTRELAAQVAASATEYGRFLTLRTIVIFGGVSEKPQIEALRRGCDVLVATQGRLLDLAQQRLLDLSAVRCCVLEEAARNATAERIEQHAYRVPQEHKRHLLAHLIRSGAWQQVLVFTRTKHGANRLTQQLIAAGINAAAIHGNKSQ